MGLHASARYRLTQREDTSRRLKRSLTFWYFDPGSVLCTATEVMSGKVNAVRWTIGDSDYVDLSGWRK